MVTRLNVNELTTRQLRAMLKAYNKAYKASQNSEAIIENNERRYRQYNAPRLVEELNNKIKNIYKDNDKYILETAPQPKKNYDVLQRIVLRREGRKPYVKYNKIRSGRNIQDIGYSNKEIENAYKQVGNRINNLLMLEYKPENQEDEFNLPLF
jgi:hypothetical protein